MAYKLLWRLHDVTHSMGVFSSKTKARKKIKDAIWKWDEDGCRHTTWNGDEASYASDGFGIITFWLLPISDLEYLASLAKH